ncbi:hypothetical protein JNJ66_06940 [Candidatus Saccharibacteria bacterium]|nr:hypothetical protein [Candidatus Saccharibacteria bacterium]
MTAITLTGLCLISATLAAGPAASTEAESAIPGPGLAVLSDNTASQSGYIQFSQTVPAPGTPLTCAVSSATGATGGDAISVAANAADAHAAIQQAINQASAAGGGTVALPAGTHTIDAPLILKSDVRLQGAGADTIIKAGANFLATPGPHGGSPLITTDGANNVSLVNFTADQSGDVLDGNSINRLNEYLIDIRFSTNVIVDRVHTRNPFTYSIVAADSTKFCIRGSSTQISTSGKYDQLDGIHILNSSFGDVIGNTVDQQSGGQDGDDGLVAHPFNGEVHDIAYIGNTVRGGVHGAGMQLAYTAAGDRIYNLTIQNNEFKQSPEGIHTGTYGEAGSSDNIVIGGAPGKGNIFHNNNGDAVTFEGALSNITVTHNTACKSGQFIVVGGTNTVNRDNTIDDSQC